MSFRKLSILLVLACQTVLPLQSALSSTQLEEGKKLYKEKKYREARALLEKSAQEEPKSWQAHFYLGHTLMSLGRISEAKHQYTLCKLSSSNAAVQAHCDKAIQQVDAYYSGIKKTSPSSKENGESSDGEGQGESNAKPSIEDARKAKLEEKKAAVMKEANDRCKEIRAKAEQQIKDEKSNSNQRFRYSDGSRGTDISDEREAEIREQAEVSCRKILENAERNARSYR